jgi:hypothetical protein
MRIAWLSPLATASAIGKVTVQVAEQMQDDAEVHLWCADAVSCTRPPSRCSRSTSRMRTSRRCERTTSFCTVSGTTIRSIVKYF